MSALTEDLRSCAIKPRPEVATVVDLEERRHGLEVEREPVVTERDEIRVLSRRERRRSQRHSGRRGTLLVLTLLLIAGVVHGWGMKTAPADHVDEGTYVAEAWASQTQGTLSHYTYFYDHPPGGTLQIAGFAFLTDAFGRAGGAVDNARPLTLVVQLTSCALLYLLARRLRLRRLFAAATVLLFALSPLAVSYHRYVMLDNIAIPWILAAFVLALSPRRRLAAHAASALCFGVAVMSKETALLLLPALVWQLWQASDARTRRYCLAIFGGSLIALCASYVLYAALKGELFAGPGHVSLLGTVKWELVDRKGTGNILDPTSDVRGLVREWLRLDWWLPALGLLAAPLAFFVRRLRPIAAAFITTAVMVVRPGYVPYAFVIGLLPFAALLVAGLADATWGTMGQSNQHERVACKVRRSLMLVLASGLCLAAGPAWARTDRRLMTEDHNVAARAAKTWISHSVPHDSNILVDDVFWIDLVRDGRPANRVVSVLKLDLDPEVARRFPRGWRDIDYVIASPYFRSHPAFGVNASQDMLHSELVKQFGYGPDAIEVLRVGKRLMRPPSHQASRGERTLARS
jgi:Dolichyl-phosphate-mannose-protein mannosyltransferase